MNIAIILAGGKGERMGVDKLSLVVAGKTILEHAVSAFNKEKVVIASGGATRQETLKKALAKLRGNPLIIVHNGANPMVTRKEIDACIQAAQKHGAAYVGCNVSDTIHDKTGRTLGRDDLIQAQTPQCAYLKDLKKAMSPGIECTDEVQLLEQIGIKAKFVKASENNFKITTWKDFEYFKYLTGETVSGIGEDAHNFSRKHRGLTLGGIKFSKEPQTIANSDGDVIIHALINAIQSALGRKSLGSFADKMCGDGVKDSKKYLARVLPEDLKIKEIRISVECEKLIIDPISDRIKQSLKKITGCSNTGITATTGNRSSNRIKATCLVTLTQK